MGMWPVKSHGALGLEGPYIWFNALIYHLEMLDNSWTRNSTFSFCTEPYKLCSKPCTPRRNVFAEYHLTQIRAVFHQVRTPEWGQILSQEFLPESETGNESSHKNERSLERGSRKCCFWSHQSNACSSQDIQFFLGFRDLSQALCSKFLFLLHLAVVRFCSL